MHDFQQLRVWQEGIDFVEEIYRATAGFPADERFNLVSQLRRAAVSIPSNISEGAGRGSDPDFVRFLYMATGSCSEILTQLIVSHRLGFLPSEEMGKLEERRVSIHKMLNRLIQKLGG